LQLPIVAVSFIGFSEALILCTRINVQAHFPVTPSTVICSSFHLPHNFFSKENVLFKTEVSFFDAVQDLHEEAKQLDNLLENG